MMISGRQNSVMTSTNTSAAEAQHREATLEGALRALGMLPVLILITVLVQ
jgi:predicted ABC-type sugar transport system permease subunit